MGLFSLVLEKFRKSDTSVCRADLLESPEDIAPDRERESLSHKEQGDLFLKSGQLDQAEMCYRKAVELNPGFIDACINLGFVLCEKKNYEAALDEALQMNVPTCIWDPIARAAVYGKLGAKQDGQKALEQLLALEPDFPQKRERLLYCMLSDGKWVRLITEGLIKAGLP